MYKLPTSWRLAAGVGSLAATLYKTHRAQKLLTDQDAREKFITWDKPAVMPVVARRVAGRRVGFKRRRYTARRTSNAGSVRRLVRWSGAGTATIAAAGSTIGVASTIALSGVQTSDLVSNYKFYRIRKVVLHVVPNVALGNSGVTGNGPALLIGYCDPETTTVPTSSQQASAYDNAYMKQIVDGEKFRYTFYPKPVNTMDVAGVATAVGGYGATPWIALTASGITVPHRSYGLWIQNAGPAPAGGCIYTFYTEVHFDVKGFN